MAVVPRPSRFFGSRGERVAVGVGGSESLHDAAREHAALIGRVRAVHRHDEVEAPLPPVVFGHEDRPWSSSGESKRQEVRGSEGCSATSGTRGGATVQLSQDGSR